MNRTIAPELKTINHVELITPKRVDLGNNVDLFWIDNTPDKTIKLDFIWNAGSKYQNKPLLSQFCNQLIFSGNNEISSNEIAESIDSLGGYLSHYQNKDHAGFTIFGLKDSILQIFNTVQSSFELGFFPQIELDKWKEIKKKEFELNEEKVSIQARKHFTKVLFGENHPYGKLANINDFDNIKQGDLQSFFKQKYLSSKPTLFLVGNAPYSLIDDLKKFVSQFNDTKNSVTKSQPTQSKESKYLTKKDAIQTAIRIGRLCIDKKHPDFIGLQILNVVLGGYFGSRLMKNIREDKGYTYGIGSGLTVLEDASYFFISTEVAVEKREATLKEIYYEMSRLQTELVQQDELTVVKNYMLGSFLRNSDGAIAMMEKYKNIHMQNLGESYYFEYIKRINEITNYELQGIARKYFSKTDFSEISFG